MDIVVYIILGWCIGYLSHEWIKSYQKKRTIQRANREYPKTSNLDYHDQICNNYYSTSTAPRKSAMRFITLEDLLKGAIEEENYENAAKLRDAIKKQNNNEDNNSC